MAISYIEAKAKLERMGQGHVLAFWDKLDNHARIRLLGQIETLDAASVARMKSVLTAKSSPAAGAIAPAPVLTPSPSERANARRIGEEALRAGRVGVLLVAGGQGSRLGFEGPKGIFPIGPVSDAPLFEVHAHKVLALERRYGANVPLYIMTSDTNDAATRDFFSAHGHFGLSPDRVVFFMQGMWPALTSDGRIVLDAPDHVFVSPDGHGGILSALKANGALDDMRRRGLETLFYFQVDNPLVDVADAAFIGLHRSHHADVSVKVCAKRDPDEGLGVVVVRDGRHAVVEYTELTAEQKHARTPGGDLEFLYGSVAIHVFSLDFLVREAEAGLPIHVAHKKVPYCDGDGKPVKPTQPNAFKFERFIFDTIPDASRVLNVAFAREDEFSPVKNAEGSDSPATTRRDQTRKYARWLEAAGVVVPRGPGGEPAYAIEIDPLFALDAAELKGRLPRGFSVSGPVLLR